MKGGEGIYIKFKKKCDQCRLVVLAQELLPFFPQRIIGKSVFFFFFSIITAGKGRCKCWGKAADAVKYAAMHRTEQHHHHRKHTNTNTRAH